ncbi:hypothetical protein E2C01_093967 [Portunus trituberculatus]|uniref:Uncharacterized protein n=1 Tax=Portunus trituberculatus TaxID=210409 RepID=A0A5B7JVY8_PORTR|nr:hypothetical protein [Portunus trituberculatus]
METKSCNRESKSCSAKYELVDIAIKRGLDCNSSFTLGKTDNFIPHLDLASPCCTRRRKRRKRLALTAPSDSAPPSIESIDSALSCFLPYSPSQLSSNPPDSPHR